MGILLGHLRRTQEARLPRRAVRRVGLRLCTVLAPCWRFACATGRAHMHDLQDAGERRAKPHAPMDATPITTLGPPVTRIERVPLAIS